MDLTTNLPKQPEGFLHCLMYFLKIPMIFPFYYRNGLDSRPRPSCDEHHRLKVSSYPFFIVQVFVAKVFHQEFFFLHYLIMNAAKGNDRKGNKNKVNID